MRNRSVWLVSILLLFSLACSALPFGKAEPTAEAETPSVAGQATNTPAPSVPKPTPTEAGSTEAESEAFEVDSDAFASLQSYRTRVVWRHEKADGAVEEMTIEAEATRDPVAQRLVIMSGEDETELIQIEDQVWMRFGDEWIQTSSSEAEDLEDQFSNFLTEDWITDLEGEPDSTEFLGVETVNGLKTRHYRTVVNKALAQLLQMNTEGATLESGTAEVWVADESPLPKFVVRSVVTLEAKSDEGTETVSWTQDVYDVNEDFVIEPPEEGPAGGLPEGVPLYPGATDVTTFGTMSTFVAPDDMETVVQFYEDALANAGWTKGEGGMETEDMLSTTWSKDGQSLTLMIMPNEDSGTAVTLMLETGE